MVCIICVITHIGEGSLLVVQTQFLVIKLGLFENLSEPRRIEVFRGHRVLAIQRPVRGLAYSVKLLCLSLKQIFLSKAVLVLMIALLLIFQILLIVEYIIVDGSSTTVAAKFSHCKLSLYSLRIKGLLVVSIIKLDHRLKRRAAILMFHGKVEVSAVSDDLAHGHIVPGGSVGAAHAHLLHLILRREQTLSIKMGLGYVRISILLLIYMLKVFITLKVSM